METSPAVPLLRLIKGLPCKVEILGDPAHLDITAITFDSRKVAPGHLFVALSGGSCDGHDFIPAALEQGATAVLGTRQMDPLPVPYLRVEDSREALAWLAAEFYDHPGRKLTVIGVTGTDGKTTTSNLLFQILRTAGFKTGLVSTVNAVIGDEVMDTGFHVTTPEATEVQKILAKMVAAGLTHVVLETTSHGLAQHRVTGCEYDLAVVTNITHEHLDYHGSYEGYRAAKARLFQELERTVPKTFGNPRLAVLNADDQSYPFLDSLVKGPRVTYRLNQQADFYAIEIQYSSAGVRFLVNYEGGSIPVTCALPGGYNVSNCLAAFAAAVGGVGVSPQDAATGIASLKGVPGRMEFIDMGQDFLAIVDFAHTPNALIRAVETAREMTSGRVITVFGSAGLRDREKRRLMAAASVRLADVSILTAEDPRTESLEEILAEMADEAVKAGGVEGKTFFRVPDRGDAIRLGVKLAQPGDLVMPCGKGHEQSMCFGTVEHAWDDRTALRAALAEHLNLSGPPMPELPTSTTR